jgi:tripartite-type tricarboxylate transporter receptor subunit TctC
MEENRMKRLMILVISAAMAASLFAAGGGEKGGTAGPAYPAKQIRLIVQANPGGSSDVNCRTIAPGLEKALGVPVVVENRPGGGGGVALTWGAAQPPDGYVVLHTPNDIAMLKPTGSADVTPDDYAFICRTAVQGASIAVKSDSKYKTFQDFMDDVRARPGQVTVGNSGIGAVWHLAAVQLENATGVKFSHIPFEGGAPAVTAAMGGHLDAVVASPAEVVPQVQGGDLRLLAIFYDDRIPLFPDIPTLKELGINLSVLAYLGFGVPKGTPQAVIDTLAGAFKESYDSPLFQDMLKSRALEPGWMGPEEYSRFVHGEFDKYMKLAPEILGKN